MPDGDQSMIVCKQETSSPSHVRLTRQLIPAGDAIRAYQINVELDEFHDVTMNICGYGSWHSGPLLFTPEIAGIYGCSSPSNMVLTGYSF